MFKMYLLLGTNLGNRLVQLERAFREIEKGIGKIIRYSSIYETAAWGIEENPPYLNQALLVETELSPILVLKRINEIERLLGRVRYLKWESRCIDIDILFYDDRIIKNEQLTIPHPLLHQRRFVLVPLAEIATDFIHPVSRKKVSALLKDLEDDLSVEKIES